MNNKKITIMFILIATITLLGIVGFTIAYFTSSTDFENEFQTGLYQTEATEVFTSPENWLPGDTTPKELTITNTGEVDVKARVCIEEEWESDNGDTLPLEQNGNRAAIINLANTSDWTYRLGCYEYNDTLEPNDTTTSFIESVTFNPNIEADIECTTSGNTKTCSSTGDGYDNATYTLTLRVETIQASAYEELWHPIQFVNRQNEGQITTGDEITIDTEHFYVVSSDANETVLLAKYNLLVGDVFEDDEDHDLILVKTLSASDTGYGLQNSEALGSISLGQNEKTVRYIGVVPFSGTNYWDNSLYECVGTNCSYTGTRGLLSDYTNASNQEGTTNYATPYPYVYKSNIGNTIPPQLMYSFQSAYGYAQNNGYTIAYYVENYKNKLIELGISNSIEGRLLSYEEAKDLGCDDSVTYHEWCSSVDSSNNPTTASAPNWVYSVNYWLGSARNYTQPYYIRTDGNFGYDSFYFNHRHGVRPVIVLRTSDI